MSTDLLRMAGRMVMVGVRGASPDDAVLRADIEVCREAGVGGVILFDVHLPASGPGRRAPRNILSPSQTRSLIDHLREQLGEHLLVAVDQEGGAVMRLSPARGFRGGVSAKVFASMTPEAQRHEAEALAGEVASLGIDINFAPCVDIGLNASSPIIASLDRSFSADPHVVTRCAEVVLGAHEAAGVASCLKHYPGHGSAAADTHEGFVDITEVFDPSAELAPYRALAHRAPMVMTGHLLDSGVDPDRPASLSASHTTSRLRNELGFQGVVVVDSLDMRAVAAHHSLEDAVALAVAAGADIVLDGVNAPGDERGCPAVQIRDAIARSAESPEGAARLAESARRIDALRRAN